MLVQCPKCKTIYKVSEALLKGAAPTFRCSRCKHTFELDWQAAPEKPAATAPLPEVPRNKSEDECEMSFAFTPKEQSEPFEKDSDIFVVDSTFDDPPKINSEEILDQWSISDNRAKHEQPFTISLTHDPDDKEKNITPSIDHTAGESRFQPSPPRQDEGDKILSLDPYRDQQASTLPFLTIFGLAVLFYSIATAFHHVHPKASEDFVKKIPLVGPSVVKNNQLKNGVLLQSLRAGYQQIQGNREVFIITGVALNQNPVVIREVRIAGQVYNQEGKAIEQQATWVGNPLSPKIVRGLTTQDISNLQRLKPLKTFEIPPGDSASFIIVFLKPSKGLKDFSCEIVSAEEVDYGNG